MGAMKEGDPKVLEPLKTKAWKEEYQNLVDYLNHSREMISTMGAIMEMPGLSKQDPNLIGQKWVVQQSLDGKLKDI